jgi:hypothetical protein
MLAFNDLDALLENRGALSTPCAPANPKNPPKPNRHSNPKPRPGSVATPPACRIDNHTGTKLGRFTVSTSNKSQA